MVDAAPWVHGLYVCPSYLPLSQQHVFNQSKSMVWASYLPSTVTCVINLNLWLVAIRSPVNLWSSFTFTCWMQQLHYYWPLLQQYFKKPFFEKVFNQKATFDVTSPSLKPSVSPLVVTRNSDIHKGIHLKCILDVIWFSILCRALRSFEWQPLRLQTKWPVRCPHTRYYFHARQKFTSQNQVNRLFNNYTTNPWPKDQTEWESRLYLMV